VHERPAAVSDRLPVGEGRRIRIRHPGRKQGQLNVVSRRQRQVLVNPRVNDSPDLHGVRGEQRGGARDFDRLGDRADAQLNVYARFLVQFEYDALTDGRCEALSFDAHVIRAYRQARQVVDARRVALSRPGGASQHICGGYLRLRNRSTRGIGDRAGDAGGHFLAAGRLSEIQEKRSEQEDPWNRFQELATRPAPADHQLYSHGLLLLLASTSTSTLVTLTTRPHLAAPPQKAFPDG